MIALSVRKPVAVLVGVVFVALFGTLSLLRVPIQLTPDVVKPEITIETQWRGASPHEIEREIIDEQEEQLKGVEGVERMTSESLDNLGRIILRFPPGTNIDTALIRVSNRLEQVPEYPEDADKPVIMTTNKTDNAMAWFMLYRLEGNDRPIDGYYRLAEDVVKPELERVPGVGASNVYGGREEELHVVVDPQALAARGITVPELMRAVDRENRNISGGDFSEGKRRYKVRTLGEYVEPEDVENIVIETDAGRRVYLRDIADVRVGMKKRDNFVRQRGTPTIAINCVRSIGANVLESMQGVRETVEALNRDVLDAEQLRLVQVYDETEYIEASIDRVVDNLLIGSLLAVIVLFAFLRSVASTLIIALAIPISIVGSFVLMHALDRSINVISLAGMTFASGMVVDNAIVSLENIFRLRQAGKSRFEAAVEGVRQIWGAVLASTLTTIAVFLPIFFVDEKAGQLFRDIAIAISCSVGLSLFVSVTVIPSLAAKLLVRVGTARAVGDVAASRRTLGSKLGRLFVAPVELLTRSPVASAVVALVLTVVSLLAARLLTPDAEYLPQGNRNLAIGILVPPPGYSIDELSRIGGQIEERLAERFETGGERPAANVVRAAARTEDPDRDVETATRSAPEAGKADAALPDIGISHFFFVANQSSVFMGAKAADSARAGELVPVMRAALGDLPGLIAIVQQASLFERGISSGRRVDIEITGPDLDRLLQLGGMVFGQTMQLFPPPEGNQARPIPNLLATPEVHVVPDRERARDLGLDASDIGLTIDAILDGAKASEFKLAGREIDLSVLGGARGRDWQTQDLESIPIYTPSGKMVPLASVANVTVTRGPQQINHLDRDRAVTIQLVPAKNVPIERAVTTIREQLVAPLSAAGAIERPFRLRLAGTADDLAQAYTAFKWNFLLAVVITYLLMAALFESFVYPFVVLFSVPLAAVGGLICLALVHAYVPSVQFDILTMLGFVILVGVVVNNAILIVYQTLGGVSDGLSRRDAIVGAVQLRVRPILMTMLTSGFGMLPLVVFPGAGSELYRGLGSVVVGGLVVSTLFTLVLIPCLLTVVLAIQARWFGAQPRRGALATS